MTLTGSWWVVDLAHIQASTFSGRSQDHGQLSVVHRSKLSFFFLKKTCTYVLNSPVRTAKKKWRAVGTSTRADTCAFTSEPQLLPSKSVPDGSDSRGACTHVSTPWSTTRCTRSGAKKTLRAPSSPSQAQVVTRSGNLCFQPAEKERAKKAFSAHVWFCVFLLSLAPPLKKKRRH